MQRAPMAEPAAARPNSLRAFHATWLSAGALGCLLLATGWQALDRYGETAAAQDARLAAEVVRLAASPAGLAALPAHDESSPLMVRAGTLSGERLAGAAPLPPYPWPHELHAGDAPVLYFSHADGRLVRVAAALLPATTATPAPVLQVAQSLAARLPAPAQLWSGWLPGFFMGAAIILVLAIASAAWSRRWTLLAAHSLESAGEASTSYQGPAELQAAFLKMQALHQEQRRWVDEQRRFLADAAHQLRTPMAVLRTQLQTALQREGDGRESLEAMVHTVDRATGLANQLLSVSKLEQLKRDGQLMPVSLQAAVRDAVVELSPLIARKRLDFSLEGDEVQAPGEPMMMGELLRNLLANAIHHSLPGARLGVVLRSGLPWAELVVWDEGESIDSTVGARLFTPFSAGKGGVGLGLSICRQLAQAMGANVSLHNRIEGGRVVGVDAVVAWGAPAGATSPVLPS